MSKETNFDFGNQMGNKRLLDNCYPPVIESRYSQAYPFFHQNRFTFPSNFPLMSNQPPNVTGHQTTFSSSIDDSSNKFDSIATDDEKNNKKELNNQRDNDTSNSVKNHNKDHGSRKQGKPVPVEKKDENYWERRIKNNLSAKRSRAIRRTKAKITEEEINRASTELSSLKHHLFVLKREELRLQQVLDGL